jgi:polysaccharide deacetylase 2 family uncharacterized protein YibQ
MPWVSTRAGQLAIIIDDLGYNLELGKRATDLSGDFTFAILPFTPHGIELAERAHKRGKEIMLHAPMSNERQLPLGSGALVSGMTREAFIQVLREDLANVPHIKGVNNHMGSQLTQEADTMSWLMHELKSRQLYFVDSRTTPKTQALAMAEAAQVPSRKRDVFLDDQRDIKHIRQQLLLAVKTARQQGSAVAIGHPYRNTLEVLEQIKPLLDQYRVQLVKASNLMPIYNSSISFCTAPPVYLWTSTPIKVNPVTVELPF